MKSVGSTGSSSIVIGDDVDGLTLCEKPHNVMTALMPDYLQSVIVEISLQSHRYVVN